MAMHPLPVQDVEYAWISMVCGTLLGPQYKLLGLGTRYEHAPVNMERHVAEFGLARNVLHGTSRGKLRGTTFHAVYVDSLVRVGQKFRLRFAREGCRRSQGYAPCLTLGV